MSDKELFWLDWKELNDNEATYFESLIELGVITKAEVTGGLIEV